MLPHPYFDDYDYNNPRYLNELIPVTTQEVKLTGGISCPFKERYDVRKSMMPNCIIHLAEYDHEHFDDDEDSSD